MLSMAFDPNNQAAISEQAAGIAGAETIPTFGNSAGRDLLGRILPPLLAVGSVLGIWWLLYLIYPRLLPSPMSTVERSASGCFPTARFSSICIKVCAGSSSAPRWR